MFRSLVVPIAWVAVLSCGFLGVQGGPASAQPGPTPGKGGVLGPGGGDSHPGATAIEPPLSLTASDGSGLTLVSLQARAVVEDPLAFTELHLVFENPENRQREGRFRITLPTGATISRFAMKIGQQWMEGEVVERQAARRAYEDFLHRRQDPALLENEAGNEFSARIFPIPPRARKEIIVSYSQELTRTDEPYRLPLLGLPKLGELDVRVLVGGEGDLTPASSLGGHRIRQQVVEVQKRDFRPDRDLVIADRGAALRMGLRHDNLVVARVTPVAQATAPDGVRSLLVLFDTSASRALGFAAQVTRLEQVIARLRADKSSGDFDLRVVAFDQEIKPMFEGRASGYGADDSARLRARGAEGASNIELALADAVSRYAGRAKFDRLLLVSDGAVTAGSDEGDALADRVRALSSIGVRRIDVLAVGGIRDDARLAALAHAAVGNGPAGANPSMSAGMVLAVELSPEDAARRLTLATRAGLQVSVAGANWVWPSVLDGVQAGDQVLVYADLPVQKPVRIEIAGRAMTPDRAPFADTARPLLERAWVKARLSRLAEQRDTLASGDRDLRAALRAQMIELSTRFRVLCDDTALLVLETEADYARFHIDRRALTDIVTVGPGGIDVINRSAAAIAVVRNDPPANLLRFANDANEEKQKTLRSSDARGTDDGRMGLDPAKAPASAAAADEPADRQETERDANKKEDVGVARMASRGAPRPDAAPSSNRAPARPAPSSPVATESFGAGSIGMSPLGSRAGVLAPRQRHASPDRVIARPRPTEPAEPQGPAPLEGELAAIAKLIARGDRHAALVRARAWRARDPGDVLAIVALGQAHEAAGDKNEAARVFGSIIDLFPSRADMRRFAAGQLERLRTGAALAIAIDTLEKSVAQRPDHPSSHHLLAIALLKAGEPARAFEVVENALKQSYPDGRFAGALRILQEDLGLAAAAWIRRSPAQRPAIASRLAQAGGTPERAASVRFVLTWETDANDVDFHIRDGRGGHAFYSKPELPSGGSLYADVTTGYGPECFTVRGRETGRAFPYRLQAHYYSKGPMGYGMGRLEIIDHDGAGNLRFESRPFVVMTDGAFLNLGTYTPGTFAGGKAIKSPPSDRPSDSPPQVGQVLSPIR